MHIIYYTKFSVTSIYIKAWKFLCFTLRKLFHKALTYLIVKNLLHAKIKILFKFKFNHRKLLRGKVSIIEKYCVTKCKS